jgi:flavin-dependent dehydrogenase
MGRSAGITIRRFHLNQMLLERATEAGAKTLGSTRARSPIIEGNRVVGVRCRGAESASTTEVRGKVTIDATGWRGMLRSALPRDWPAAEVIPRTEMAVAYREERVRETPVEELIVEATFDFDIAPGGLYWVADRTDVLVNVGVGMQWVPGLPSPRRTIRDRVIPMIPRLMGTKLIRSSGGIIPNRRPIDCPVADGFLAVGDAASQVQPLTGSGIGSSMFAARVAAEAIVKALRSTDAPTIEDLFTYPRAYNEGYGTDQAANQVLREALQTLSNDQMNRLMAARLVSEEELVTAVRVGRLDLGFKSKLKAATKLMVEPRLIKFLAKTHSDMEVVRVLYSEYPLDPTGLQAWRTRVQKFLAKTRA